jgi:hypothetical protein
MVALSTIHDVTGRRLVSSIYSWDIYGIDTVGILSGICTLYNVLYIVRYRYKLTFRFLMRKSCFCFIFLTGSVCETHVERFVAYEAMCLVRDSLWSAGWGGEGGGNPAWLRIWLLDMSLLEGADRLAVLLAAINQNDQVSQVREL